MLKYIVTAVFVCSVARIVSGFPDGAPADTCVKNRVNQPNHGAARSQELGALPYQVVADSDAYQPGQVIKLQIAGQDVFRGFFFQARDADTNDWIGEWQQSPNTKVIPECSAITHADNKDKSGATLIWKAPQHKKGRVYFTGAIVKDYGTFWADIVAKIPVYQQQ